MFSHSEFVEEKVGNNGLNKIVMHSPNKRDSAEIYLFGAHLTSYKRDGKELLFVSKKSSFDGNKPIRGGMPIVFPQFGISTHPNLPQHGFARTRSWEYKGSQHSQDCVSVTFELHDSEETRKLWDYQFKLSLVFYLCNNMLRIEFIVENQDDKAFPFTNALHTYFAADVAQTGISDLKGLEFVDKVKEAKTFKQEESQLTIAQEIDRVYRNSPSQLKLRTGHWDLMVSKSDNMKDFVIWNPWIERAQKIADLDDEEYKDYVCIEPANAVVPITIDPTHKITFTHTIQQV